jgi:hypothetical protein
MGENIKVVLLNSRNETAETLKLQNNIYLDDTIETIKNKIIMTSTPPIISYNEIYIFSYNYKHLDLLKIYNLLSNTDIDAIDSKIIHQLCLNLNIEYKGGKKTVNNFDDFYTLLQGDKHKKNIFQVSCPIGIDVENADDKSILFPVNPVAMVIPCKNTNVKYSDQKLMFEYVDENCREIFVCLTKELSGNKVETPTNIFKNYYPRLYNDKITSFNMYNERNPEYIIESEKNIEKNGEKNNFDAIDYIYNQSTLNPSVSSNAVLKSFTIYMLPQKKATEIPSLDIIFKNLHTSKIIPMIYYPTNINNTFRLYCDKVATNGKKIPYLTKSRIIVLWNKIRKNNKISGINEQYIINKTKKITLYIHQPTEDGDVELFMDFKSNGVITIYSERLDKPLSLNELNHFVKTIIHPILESINLYLRETGFSVEIHDDILNNPNVMIENVLYKFTITDIADMEIKKMLNCSNLIFLPSVVKEKHSELYYRRISQFKRLNAELLFVIKRINELGGEFGMESKIVEELKQIYHFSQDQSVELFREGLEKYDKNLDINSGFFTTFHVNDRKELIIEIQNISNVAYLHFITKIIMGLLEISKNKDDLSILCNYSKSQIQNQNRDDDDVVIGEEFIIEDEDDHEDEDDDEDNDEDEDNKKIKYIPMLDIDENDENENNTGNDDDANTGLEDDDNNGNELQDEITKAKKVSNIFLKRLQERAPKLFDFTGDKPYSRQCLGDDKPVILTEKEKEIIDKKDAEYAEPSYGETNNAIFMNYDKKQNFYFICPRYWSIHENRSISEKELKDHPKKYQIVTRKTGKLGNVYEFTPHGKTNLNRFPDIKKIKNPDGVFLPCCYQSKQKETNRERNVSEYISSKDPPIGNERLGFLPPSLELFFGIKRNLFIESTKPRPNVYTLLRYGVDEIPLENLGNKQSQQSQQSFLACFANIYGYIYSTPDNEKKVSIEEMTHRIIKAVNLDVFVKLHNSSLVSVFQPIEPDYKYLEGRIEKYQNTDFFKTLELKDDIQERFLLDTIASYENFIEYLKDPSITKDHTYLWDIFTRKNELLFGRDINLIIIQIVDDDNTEKINFICPTNIYSENFYNEKNESVILIMKNNIYEPVCLYGEIKKGTTVIREITKTFNIKQLSQMISKTNQKNAFLLNNITHVLNIIHKNIHQSCMSVPGAKPPVSDATASFPNQNEKIIHIQKNILPQKLFNIIREKQVYTVKCQVLNYNHKVIGFVLLLREREGSQGNNECFIPCYPAEPIDEVKKITYIDNDDLWKSYDETVEEINKVYETHKGKIPCKLTHVVVETNFNDKRLDKGANKIIPIAKLVVGVLTETNQFIQVVERPYDPEHHTLPILEHSNMNKIDKILTTTNSKEDDERITIVNNILFEGQFYSSFRSVLRALLNDYKHRNSKKTILEYIQSNQFYYKDKIKMIKKILYEISKDDVEFSNYDEKTINNISSTLKGKFCVLQNNDDSCKVNIPRTNLVNKQDNKSYYYIRLADELLRYKRIQLFMFEGSINMVDIEFKINEDELIIIDNLLFSDGAKNGPSYFDNVNVFKKNKYTHVISYMDAQPYDVKVRDKTFHN